MSIPSKGLPLGWNALGQGVGCRGFFDAFRLESAKWTVLEGFIE